MRLNPREKTAGLLEVRRVRHMRFEYATVRDAATSLLDCVCILATVRRIWHRITRDAAPDPLFLEQVVAVSHSMIFSRDECY
jgi:hypothetical protein